MNEVEIVEGFFDNRQDTTIADKLGMFADIMADTGAVQITVTLQEGSFIGIVNEDGNLSFEKIDMNKTMKRQQDEANKLAELARRIEALENNA